MLNKVLIMLYAVLIPVALVSVLGLIFGVALAIGPWSNPQAPEERKKALESGACSHCVFDNVCHMSFDGDAPEDCEEYDKENT
jgi:hypothetical protein